MRKPANRKGCCEKLSKVRLAEAFRSPKLFLTGFFIMAEDPDATFPEIYFNRDHRIRFFSESFGTADVVPKQKK
jgi:hypothetical protein